MYQWTTLSPFLVSPAIKASEVDGRKCKFCGNKATKRGLTGEICWDIRCVERDARENEERVLGEDID